MGLRVESNISRSFDEPVVPSKAPEVGAIASYVRAGRCVLFVGAGLSMNAGLPSWNGLMQRIIAAATPNAVDSSLFAGYERGISLVDHPSRVRRESLVVKIRKALGSTAFDALVKSKCRGDETPDAGHYLDALGAVRWHSVERHELTRLLAAGRNQEVAARCRDLLGWNTFVASVREVLGTTATVPATHHDIAKTPFSCIVTTNFDDLLERTYEETRGERPPAPTGAELHQHGDLLLRSSFFILKAHGDLANPDSLVFTADDYRRIVHSNPAFQAVMSGILMTNAVVFVGYSLNDVNFRLLLDQQLTTFVGRVPPRFALLSGAGPAECETLWRTARLRVIPYPNGQHQEVAAFLAALAKATGTSTQVRRRLGKRAATGKRSAQPTLAVLSISSDGQRLSFELARHQQGSAAQPLWSSTTAWLEFDGLRASVAETMQPAYTLKQLNTRLAAAAAAVTRLIPSGLLRALRGLPEDLVVELAADGATEPVPWEWALVSGQSLGLRNPVVRRPVELTPSARGVRRPITRLRALVIGDAGDGAGSGTSPLPMAEVEADHIAETLRAAPFHGFVKRLSREQATAARLLRELETGSYDVLHFAGHAWAGPQDAYLCLWDRLVLGTELAPLISRCPPALFALSTHHTAFFPLDLDRNAGITPADLAAPKLHGEAVEDRGFTSLAMRCGVTSLVGCCGSVSDEGSMLVMSAFYDLLAKGDTIAMALRGARKQALAKRDRTGILFVAVGDSDFALASKSRTRSRRKQALNKRAN